MKVIIIIIPIVADRQTDEDECRQILRASASAENERNATVSGLEIQN